MPEIHSAQERAAFYLYTCAGFGLRGKGRALIMLTFNGKKYAKNESELVDTLFKSGGTANGLYKTTKNKTLLYKPNGELFACIIHNQKQGYFAVSASIQRGKPYFMYALCEPDEKYLGLDCIPYGQVAMLIRETFA